MTQLQLSGLEAILAICIVAFIVIAIIFSFKKYFKYIAANKVKTASSQSITPLDSRTKYLEINVFNWTKPIFLIGLAAAISISLFAFSWTVEYQKTNYSDAYNIEPITQEIEVIRTKHPTLPKPKLPIEEVKIVLTPIEQVKTIIDLTIDPEEAIETVNEEPTLSGTAGTPSPPIFIPKAVEPKDAPDEILPVAEQMPRFPGCEDLQGTREEKRKCAEKKLLDYIYDNLKYPKYAIENGIEGVAIVRFVVDKNGEINDAKVLRNPGGGCGEAALSVVEAMNNMPDKWTPGRQRGRKVKVMYTLPIKFKLR